jgi:hypothetical protein
MSLDELSIEKSERFEFYDLESFLCKFSNTTEAEGKKTNWGVLPIFTVAIDL